MESKVRLVMATQGFVNALNENVGISAKLKTALLVALLGEKDVKSVGALATACECDRTTLWRHWRQGIGERADPKMVLDFILLLRALAANNRLEKGSRLQRLLKTTLGVLPNKQLDVLEYVVRSPNYLLFQNALRGPVLPRS
jgi:hypothetical protein